MAKPEARAPGSEGVNEPMFTSRYRMSPFDLVRPRTVDELGAVYRSGSPWRFMAGGVDLKREMKAGCAVARVVDLRSIDELRRLTLRDDGTLWVGAAVTHARFASSRTVRGLFPGVGRIWESLGNVRVRHVGTLVGNIVAGFPQYHVRPVLAALDAELALYDGRQRTWSPLDADTLRRVRRDNLCVLGIGLPAEARRSCRLIRDFVPAVSVAVSARQRDAVGGPRLAVSVVGRETMVKRTFTVEASPSPAPTSAVSPVVAREVVRAAGDALPLWEAGGYERWASSVVDHSIRRLLSSAGDLPAGTRGAHAG